MQLMMTMLAVLNFGSLLLHLIMWGLMTLEAEQALSGEVVVFVGVE